MWFNYYSPIKTFNFQFINELIGNQGLLVSIINNVKQRDMNKQNSLQISLISLKCISCLLTIDENKFNDEKYISLDIKEYLTQVVIEFLMKDYSKSQDESMYCKVSQLLYLLYVGSILLLYLFMLVLNIYQICSILYV